MPHSFTKIIYPRYLFLFFLASQLNHCFSQNLILNGDFELGNQDCQASSFLIATILDDWTHTSLFPIYHRKNCPPIGASINPPFPNTGNGHLSIAGNAWVTGWMDASVVKGNLQTPLEANATYYLAFYGKSTGLRQDERFTSIPCDFETPPNLTIHLGTETDKFEVAKTFDGNTSFLTNAVVENSFYPVPFSEPILIQPNTETWTKYVTCFEAKGEETQIALAGPIRPYRDTTTCHMLNPSMLDTFSGERLHQIFAYEIDDMVLKKIPQKLEGRTTTCGNQGITINLLDYLPADTSLFNTATFRWPDGNTEIIRNLASGGFYEIEVQLACKTIPLELTIIAEDCADLAYVPTAFSPNGDGINDEFRPFFNEAYPLESYSLQIYNRWGSQVFQSTTLTQSWDGQFNQEELSTAVFFWIMTYQLVGYDKTYQKSGTVTIVNR